MVDFSSIKAIAIPEGEVKQIAIGQNILWKKEEGGLPSEYQQVEYAQSSARAYINTGINSTPTTDFEIDYMLTNTVQWGAIIGADRVGTPGRLYYGTCNNYDINTNYLYVGDNTITFSNPYAALSIKTKATYSHTTRTLTISNANGTHSQTLNYNSIENSNMPMFFFGINRQNAVSDLSKVRIYYVKIIEDGAVKGEFIPCYRKSDSVIGYYDLVSKTFKTNAGSSKFTKGPDVNN